MVGSSRGQKEPGLVPMPPQPGKAHPTPMAGVIWGWDYLPLEAGTNQWQEPSADKQGPDPMRWKGGVILGERRHKRRLLKQAGVYYQTFTSYERTFWQEGGGCGCKKLPPLPFGSLRSIRTEPWHSNYTSWLFHSRKINILIPEIKRDTEKKLQKEL